MWAKVNLSATMLSTEFAAVGQIFADGHWPDDAFYPLPASCFIHCTKMGFPNCLDSTKLVENTHEVECHVKMDTLPDRRQCNLSTQRSCDSVENLELRPWIENNPKVSVSRLKSPICPLPAERTTWELSSLGSNLVRVAVRRDKLTVTRIRRPHYLRHRLTSFFFTSTRPPFLSPSAPSLTQTFGSTQSKTVLFPLLADLPLAPAPLSSYLPTPLTPPLSPLGPCLTCGWKYEDGASLPNLGRGGGPTVLIQPMVAAAFKGPAADAGKVHWNDQQNSALLQPPCPKVVTW